MEGWLKRYLEEGGGDSRKDWGLGEWGVGGVGIVKHMIQAETKTWPARGRDEGERRKGGQRQTDTQQHRQKHGQRDHTEG